MSTPTEVAVDHMKAFHVRDGDVEEISAEFIQGVIVEAIEADRAENRQDGLDLEYQYGVRYDDGDGGEPVTRGFSSRGNAEQRLVREYGDKLIRRVGAVTIPAGDWEEVPEGE